MVTVPPLAVVAVCPMALIVDAETPVTAGVPLPFGKESFANTLILTAVFCKVVAVSGVVAIG